MALNIVKQTKRRKTYSLNARLKIKEENYLDLLNYLQTRLNHAKHIHDSRVSRFTEIDKQVSGYIILDKDDKKRKEDEQKGFGPKPYETNLPLTKVQMQDAVSYLLSVYFPAEGPYLAKGKNDSLETAKALTGLMNLHSEKFSYYRHYAKGLYDVLKYNQGLWEINWKIVAGRKLSSTVALGDVKDEGRTTLFEGNEIVYLDPYNTILDPTKDICELADSGEFYAKVELMTKFELKRKEFAGELFNLDIEDDAVGVGTKYYTEIPDTLGDAAFVFTTRTKTDWASVLSAGNYSSKDFSTATESSVYSQHELVTVRIWLPAYLFKMSDAELFELWELQLLDGNKIVSANKIINFHEKLPLVGAKAWDENLKDGVLTYAEMLMPYQRFGSFLLNTHQEATRKALNGLTIFNEQILPGLKEGNSMKIPFTGDPEKIDANKLLAQFTDAPQTDYTLRDLGLVMDLSQSVLPVDQAQKLAGLERATTYHAAATVRESNLKNLMLAKLIDSQAFETARHMMLYNIMTHQKDVTIPATEEGTEDLKVNPQAIRGADIQYLVASGLRDIDNLKIQETFREIIFALMQSPESAQQVDLLSLMNYMTSIMGDVTDLNQFKFKNEFDALTMEQKQMAFGLLQEAMVRQQQQPAQ